MAMNNFVFHNPVKILFGKGQIKNIVSEIPQDAKILFTYGGGSIKKNGVYDQVIDALKNHSVIEFGGIEPNPKYETLVKAIDICKKEKIDFLLPVGGGSVIDGTKFIAAGVYVDSDPWDILTGKATIKKALPIGAILTLPATGTEMNGNAVISKIKGKEKRAFGTPIVLPKFSVLDPEVCFTLPDIQVSNGVVDAYVHIMEQYLTYPVGAMVQDSYAEALLRNLIEVGPKVLKDKTNYEYMSNFMWIATMALNGLIGSGVPGDWATHAIGHELTAFEGIDHAQTLAIVLPGVMEEMRESKKEKILQYAKNVWSINETDEKKAIDLAIDKTADFFESMGLKTKLSDYKVSASTIEKIIDRMNSRGDKLGEKQELTPDRVNNIFEIRK